MHTVGFFRLACGMAALVLLAACSSPPPATTPPAAPAAASPGAPTTVTAAAVPTAAAVAKPSAAAAASPSAGVSTAPSPSAAVVAAPSPSIAVTAAASPAAAAGGAVTASNVNTSGRQLTIPLVLFQGDSFFQNIQAGAEKEAQVNNVKLLVNNTNNDNAQEASLLAQFTAAKVDAIILSTLSETGSVAPLTDALKAGIPVVCYNTCIQDAQQAGVKAFIQSDQKALGTLTGQAAAAYIKTKLAGTAKIGLLNCDQFEACQMRKAGFKQALQDAGVTVDYVADQQGFLADTAAGVAENELTANASINLMWSANEGGTVGEVTAVKSSGKQGQVVVFGTDISSQLAQFLINPDGVFQATTGQQPILMGLTATKDAVLAVNNQPVEFLQIVPGITYSRDDPNQVNQFLSTAQ